MQFQILAYLFGSMSDNITGNNKEIFTIANSTSQALVINHYNNDLIYGVGATGHLTDLIQH